MTDFDPVGVVLDPLYERHDPGLGHPERPDRYRSVRDVIKTAPGLPPLTSIAPRDATRAEIERVHTPAYVDSILAVRGKEVTLDPDTHTSADSVDAALRAAGGVAAMVEALLAGNPRQGFAAVRPPGHHAEPERSMGFCLFNNIAIGAHAALANGVARVAIYDWDVHHGNGTQTAFERDGRVLFISSHQFPFYPGTGSEDETGRGAGAGSIVNLPLAAGSTDGDFAALVADVVVPALHAFKPQLILVSAGFDAHRRDPLAAQLWTVAGFTRAAFALKRAAHELCDGRIGFVLEGGYDLQNLAACTFGVLTALGAKPLTEPLPEAAPPRDSVRALIGRTRQRLGLTAEGS